MTRVRVKFCGMTRAEDALAAVALGVDALGFVFTQRSPRYIDPEAAGAIIRGLPPFIMTVGLFVDQDTAEVAEVSRASGVQLLQFHGEESPARCSAPGKPYIKAVRMREGVDLEAQSARYADACALLVDSFDAGGLGGSGTAFDWGRLPSRLSKPLILAGGLSAGNVARAIEVVKPYAVDVSSGIEAAKGLKDRVKMIEFMQEVRKHDGVA
jgi:phosphoribosylanthranilate isomerase